MGKKWLLVLSLMLFGLPKQGALENIPPLPALWLSQLIQPSAVKIGAASWYSETDPGINLQTANGEIFDDSRLTCASWNFPFGTSLRVTSLTTGRSVVCRVNDRGPAKRLKRLIDLSRATFQEIAPLQAGLVRVKVERLDP